jgi:hypothetical protein
VDDPGTRLALLDMMGVVPARWSIARTLDLERCRAAFGAVAGMG